MATVIEPTTKEIRRSVDTPQYTDAGWVVIKAADPEDTPALIDSLVAVIPEYRIIEDPPVDPLDFRVVRLATQSEKDDLDVDVDRIARAQSIKRGEIDQRTQELFADGFDHDGHHFSMSESAQRNMIVMTVENAAGRFLFPFKYSKSESDPNDPGGEYVIVDEVDLLEMTTAVAFSVGQQAYNSGRDLRVQVNALTTVAAVEAFVDPR